MIRIFSVSLFCILLLACASSAPKFTQLAPKNIEKGTVYFYRLSKFVAGFRPVIFSLNHKDSLSLPNGAHFSLELEPGIYTLSPIPGETSVRFGYRYQFEVKPNSYTFVKFAFSWERRPGFIMGSQVDSPWRGFEVVPLETAVKEMKDPSFEYWR